jgi:hypothetical protein
MDVSTVLPFVPAVVAGAGFVAVLFVRPRSHAHRRDR